MQINRIRKNIQSHYQSRECKLKQESMIVYQISKVLEIVTSLHCGRDKGAQDCWILLRKTNSHKLNGNQLGKNRSKIFKKPLNLLVY